MLGSWLKRYRWSTPAWGGLKKHWLHWLWRIPLLLLLLLILWLLLLRVIPVPTSAFMVQHQFAAWWDDSVPAVHYQWVDFKDIPPEVALAAVAAEDQLFPEHQGIDQGATERAIRAALEGESSGGGSTITQQVVKNLFLWSGRSYVRKGLEWCLALLLELLWSKERILEVYLNIAQFSAADYGVSAASTYLLKKPVHRLTAADGALLAAVLPAPAQYSVLKPSRYIRKRQQYILRQMQQLGGVAYLKAL